MRPLETDRVENAKIRKVFLGYEGHGILTVMIEVEWGDGLSSSLPGYNLNGPFCATYLKNVLDVLGYSDWSHIVGSYVRIVFDRGALPIRGFGHIVQDRWFFPEELAAEFREED